MVDERHDAVREQGRDRDHRRFAQENQLSSIADLSRLESFRLGARPEFENLYLGLQGLQEVYGLGNAASSRSGGRSSTPRSTSGTADAVDAFTTDPQLVGDDYEVLEDPELLFGSQNVVMTVDAAKLESSARRSSCAWSTPSTAA